MDDFMSTSMYNKTSACIERYPLSTFSVFPYAPCLVLSIQSKPIRQTTKSDQLDMTSSDIPRLLLQTISQRNIFRANHDI